MSVTIPFVLDHNRMLIDAKIQATDGSWHEVRLWVDSGNPEFFLSEELARGLGLDLAAATTSADGRTPPLDLPSPPSVRLDGLVLNLADVTAKVMFQPAWLFGTMHIGANLPSTVLRHSHVVFDYPRRQLTLAAPGSLQPRGARSPAAIHPATGIVQLDVLVGGDSLSLALDNGASYSFVSDEVLARLTQAHPEWPRGAGAVGCANIWGWWPQEPLWPLARLPEIQWGAARLTDVGLVGLPPFFANGGTLGAWYSHKTARPVDGFLGPNAFRAFRIEIDYANGAVYFERGAESEAHDLDLVGLTVRLESDGRYRVVGVAERNGQSSVPGVEPGDLLLEVDGVAATGATMGSVVDALRGRPGDVRTLLLERDGERVTIRAQVERLL